MNYIEEVFAKEEKDMLNSNKDKILLFLSSLSDVLILEDYELSYDDVKERQMDQTYLKNVSIKMDGNRLKVLLLDKETLDFIKNNMPKTIKKLTINQDVLKNDLSFILGIDSLEVLSIKKGFSLMPEEVRKIKEETNIRKINVDVLPSVISMDYLVDGFYVSDNAHSIYYDGLLVKDKREHSDGLIDITTTDEFDLNKVNDFNSMLGSTDILKVKTKDISYTLTKDLTDDYSLDVYSSDPKDTIKVYNAYKDKYEINDVVYHITGTDYLKVDTDVLKELERSVSINYGEAINVSIDSFESLKATIGYYRKLINDYDLSPVEKLMQAYDIMKTFKYNEGGTIADSRFAANVIESGHIVCAGYAQMMCEIMKGTPGIGIEYQTVSNYDKNGKYKGGHARNIVRVDDEKYNIHGIYMVDSTWDSDKSIPFIAGEKYTSLDLYNYFLIPYKEYSSVCMYDTLPNLFQEYYNESRGVKSNLLEAKVLFDEEVTIDKIKEYMNVNRLPLEELAKIVYNVRLAEGYSEMEAKKEVEKIQIVNAFNEIRYNKEDKSNVDYFNKRMN